MRKKQVLSLFMLITGVALLVAAMTVGSRQLGDEQGRARAEACKGGTLRLNEASDGLRLRRSAVSRTAPTTGRCCTRR